MTLRRLALVALLAATLLPLLPRAASAHPLGNFTVNVYAGLRVQSDALLVDYVVDLAEIPALQARKDGDTNRDGRVGVRERQRYRRDECRRLAGGIDVRLDGERVALGSAGSNLSFPPGQAGLPTLRLECSLSAPLALNRGEHRLAYRDGNFDGRIGWHELTMVGDGVAVSGGGAASSSVSRRLTAYPQDRLQSPLDQRSVTATISARDSGEAGGGAGAGPASGWATVDRITDAFTSLVATRELTVGFGLFAVAVAVLLGALHALAPGHGKTVMAAYLVGQQGSPRQALLLGLAVAVTHTLGVLALGVFLSASQAVAPERLYPWLSLGSGALFAAIGAALLRRALRRPHAHHHHHHAVEAVGGQPTLRWQSLVAPGVAGGMVPSPSALVVLLGGIALGRAWFGVILVITFGIGMALTLVGAGLLLLRARGGLEHRAARAGWSRVTAATANLPAATACVILLVGLVLTARAAAAL